MKKLKFLFYFCFSAGSYRQKQQASGRSRTTVCVPANETFRSLLSIVEPIIKNYDDEKYRKFQEFVPHIGDGSVLHDGNGTSRPRSHCQPLPGGDDGESQTLSLQEASQEMQETSSLQEASLLLREIFTSDEPLQIGAGERKATSGTAPKNNPRHNTSWQLTTKK